MASANGLSRSTVHEQRDSGKNLYGAECIDHLQDKDVSTTKPERNTLRRTLGSEWGTRCETSISVYLYIITHMDLYEKGIAYMSPNRKRSRLR